MSFVNFKNRAYDPINDGYILIENNRDFRRYNFPGSGTTADPYIIENFVFNVQPPFVDAIFIRETTYCFVIQNCTFTTRATGLVISRIASTGVIIQNNTIKNCINGMSLGHASSIIVRDNYFLNNNNLGVDVSDLQDSSFFNNTILGSELGLIVSYSINCLFEMNTFSNHYYYGFYLGYSDLCTVKNNTFAYNFLFGLDLGFTTYITVIDNDFLSCGIRCGDSYNGQSYLTFNFENNTVNNKPLGFFKNIKDTVFSESEYGQLIFVNCSGITVENQRISFTSVAISILYSENSIFRFNILNNNSYCGIFSADSQNISFTNNTCNYNLGTDHQ
ncbi:MAG: right-handed parallel beta-helix repeat-containing protein [Candidatus Heimdallarchaeota archaeon]